MEDPSSLLQFAALQKLGLHDCGWLHSLRQLPPLKTVEVLYLSGARIGCELDELVEVASKVRNLILCDCEGFNSLRFLNKLRLAGLHVDGNAAVSDLHPLSGQVHLSHLSPSKTSVDDLTPLQGLSKLEVLWLDDCVAVTDLRPLASLPSLRTLHIEGTAPGTDLSPLAHNRRLTVYIRAGQYVRGGERLGRRLKVR